jgi:hypothetical protein
MEKRKSQILSKHKIRYKTDLSIEINRDSYNHGGHHPPPSFDYWNENRFTTHNSKLGNANKNVEKW